jgi:hypothetical protein
MTSSEGAQLDIREEVDVVAVDPLFLERQRNRYASRGVVMVVMLNGLAAVALLVALATATHNADAADRFGEAMIVFGAGAAAGLASAFFAYVSRTWRLERPRLANWRRPLRWLAVLAAIAGAVCFVTGLNMARGAGKEAAEHATATQKSDERSAQPSSARPNP